MSKEIKSVNYGLEKIFEGAQDFLPLLGTDYVEFYVGNAKQAAHFYKTAFGFQSFAYAGLETGLRDRASYVLKQDKIRLVLTTALNSNSPIGEHVKKHGDGVKVVALWVEDARSAFEETTKRGAKVFMEPTVEKDEHGEVVRAGIYTYGETVHMFVERKNYNGAFLPGYKEWKSDYNPAPTGLKYVDHMVGNVGWNEMNTWVKWYEDVMGFVNFLSFDDKQITTEYSALMSKVMSNGNGRIKFPINVSPDFIVSFTTLNSLRLKPKSITLGFGFSITYSSSFVFSQEITKKNNDKSNSILERNFNIIIFYNPSPQFFNSSSLQSSGKNILLWYFGCMYFFQSLPPVASPEP